MSARMLVLAALSLLVASTSLAAPRSGANHHLGDDSFIAAFGRTPDAGDSEKLRMRTHLLYVRGLLGASAPTSLALAPRRAELLGFLDDYIALGITPLNTHVAARSPVFIDDDGRICAVGYLIQRSVGRALPEAIASTHRYEYLEPIAAAEPEVRAWIADSGMTLTELASIQPAYSEAAVDTWYAWGRPKDRPADGEYAGTAGSGSFRAGRMTGPWKVSATDDDTGKEAVVGTGTFTRGAAIWTSLYPDGTKRGGGPYANNRAHGRWALFHASGNVAAEGRFQLGTRIGRWRFYDDTAVKTPIAIGSFGADGSVVGTWHHFDRGSLVATSWSETPAQWGDTDLGVDGGLGFVLEVTPTADGIAQRIHQGTVFGRPVELTMFAKGRERIYIHEGFGIETTYDADGNKLVLDGTTWRAMKCHWAGKRKDIARAGDLARLHGLLFQDIRRRVGAMEQHSEWKEDPGPRCDEPVVVDAERAKTLDALIAARSRVRAPSPAFVQGLFTDDESSKDLIQVLAKHMGTYLEWPHIDRAFTDLFATMPGRYTWNWFDGDPRDYGTPDQPRPGRYSSQSASHSR